MKTSVSMIPHGKLDYLVVSTHMAGVCSLVVHKQAVGGTIKTESTYADLASGELNIS